MPFGTLLGKRQWTGRRVASSSVGCEVSSEAHGPLHRIAISPRTVLITRPDPDPPFLSFQNEVRRYELAVVIRVADENLVIVR